MRDVSIVTRGALVNPVRSAVITEKHKTCG
jgi:hypothetical protein